MSATQLHAKVLQNPGVRGYPSLRGKNPSRPSIYRYARVTGKPSVGTRGVVELANPATEELDWNKQNLRPSLRLRVE
jgi:hypothetical protein